MKSTCVIIPCFNEESRLDVDAFLTFDAFEILLVNDGSEDYTKWILHDLAIKNRRISNLQLDKNVGKAEAIRQGVLFLKGKFETIGYLDADLSTSLQEMERLIEIHKTSTYKIVMGSRLKIAGSQINRYWWRHFSGRLIATVIDSIFLKAGIYDTQCGAKIINGKTAQELFKTPFETKWLFDVELLLRLKKSSKNNSLNELVKEVPLSRWVDDGDSRISFKDVLKLPLSFYKIYKRYL
ncbi:MAG: glycosyltransferase [Nonlabens sp.]|uniref:glycosyltransferase n=1 Tax=Nonlabens sp. TaxID=1888209 RepID=UPI003EF3B807